MNHFKLMLSIISVLFFCACENNTSGEYGQAFSTLTLQTDSTEIHESYSASIKGRQDVDIYPQVSGVITKVCVQEGENVSKGKVLFVIGQCTRCRGAGGNGTAGLREQTSIAT